MIERINRETVELMMKFSLRPQQQPQQAVVVSAKRTYARFAGDMAIQRGRQLMQQQAADEYATNTSEADLKPRPIVRDHPKVGRNDPCPCSGGKVQKMPGR